MKYLFLAINTALAPFGWSLIENDKIIYDIKLADTRGNIESILDEIKYRCDFQKLGGVGVIQGPGSYTGIRIGLAYANALAMSLKCQIRGLDTLTAMALPNRNLQTPFVVITPSKSQHVYLKFFNTLSTRLNIQPLTNLVHLNIKELENFLDVFPTTVPFYGDCSQSVKNFFQQRGYLFYPQAILCNELALWTKQQIQNSLEKTSKQIKPIYFHDVTIGKKV